MVVRKTRESCTNSTQPAIKVRYRAAGRNQKKEILDEFVKVTGFHRKHAIRVLKRAPRRETPEPRQRARIYDEAVREALTIVWEAADRICGKRLRQVIAGLVDAMERHRHLKLDAEVRESHLPPPRRGRRASGVPLFERTCACRVIYGLSGDFYLILL